MAIAYFSITSASRRLDETARIENRPDYTPAQTYDPPSPKLQPYSLLSQAQTTARETADQNTVAAAALGASASASALASTNLLSGGRKPRKQRIGTRSRRLRRTRARRPHSPADIFRSARQTSRQGGGRLWDLVAPPLKCDDVVKFASRDTTTRCPHHGDAMEWWVETTDPAYSNLRTIDANGETQRLVGVKNSALQKTSTKIPFARFQKKMRTLRKSHAQMQARVRHTHTQKVR